MLVYHQFKYQWAFGMKKHYYLLTNYFLTWLTFVFNGFESGLLEHINSQVDALGIGSECPDAGETDHKKAIN